MVLYEVRTKNTMGKKKVKDAMVPKLPTSSMNKREKHNIYCRRGYYGIITRIQELKIQVEELENERAIVLANTEAIKQKEKQDKEEKLIALIHEKIRLEEETKINRIRLAQYELYREKIYKYQHQLQPQIRHEVLLDSNKTPEAYFLYKLSHPPQLRRLLQPQDCQKLAQKEYIAYCNFLSSNETISTGACLFGWRDRVERMHEHYIQYSFTKIFTQFKAADFSAYYFQNATSPKHMQDVLSGPVTPFYKAIQVVDANNVVMFASFWGQDMQLIKHGAFVVSRVEISENYYLVLNCPLYQDWFIPEEKSKEVLPWTSFNTWIHYQDTDSGCETCVSGRALGYSQALSRYFLMETLFVVLRWEHKYIRPISCLPMADSYDDQMSN